MELIYDIEELKTFYERIMLPLDLYEVNFLSLSCRNKYLTDEERKEYALGRTEMIGRIIIKEHDFNKFYKIIKEYEVLLDTSLVTKNGNLLPPKAVCVYININPSNTIRALNMFQHQINDYYLEISRTQDKKGLSNRLNKCDKHLMTCYQKARGYKHWLDIDIDLQNGKDNYNKEVLFTSFDVLLENKIEFVTLETKSGYHVLIKRKSLKDNKYNPYDYIKVLKENIIDWKEIDINKNEMVCVSGTYQAEFPVKIIFDSKEGFK